IPTRGYIAGKPVSRWEAADSDNIDIEYKNLDRPGKQGWCTECLSGPKGMVVRLLFLILLFCVGLVFGYVIRKSTCGDSGVSAPPADKFVPIQQDYSDTVRQQLQDRINHIPNFDDSIKVVTDRFPLSGVGNTNGLLFFIRNWLATYSELDTASILNYTVQLMYPNYTLEGSNAVSIVSGNDTIFQTHTNQTNVHPNYLPFCAFSHSGNVKGDLVYGHYGRKVDFERLTQLGVNFTDTIVLIRYGKIHPSNKIQHAEQFGVKGVIFYPDPHDYANSNDNSGNFDVTDTWWLPGDAVIRTSVRYWLTGDPLTPDYPAVDGIPRLSADHSSYPTLPAFPVSYNDARTLMEDLGGVDVPAEWKGGLGVPYKTGPGYTGASIGHEVELNVLNEYSFREIHNILATIHGQYEKGWRPRRTIIFAGWDASKYGHVGAYEWTQEYEQQLSSGAVAYINLDAAVRGNYTFYAEANPLLYDVIYEATKTVTCPEENHKGTVYDEWSRRLKNSEFSADKPWIADLPGDSDHSPFLYRLVYGTLNDTLDYFTTFIDPNYTSTQALVRVVSDIVLRLSDTAILPLNVEGYSHLLDRGIKGLEPHEDKLRKADLDMELLLSAKKDFTTAASVFRQRYSTINKKNISEFEVRFLNDKLIRVSRAFVHSGGVMSQPWYRNILMAPHPENLNEEVIFPGIITALLQADMLIFELPFAHDSK
ncbi:hypothetical protein BaRGS_00035934, partial [Batillaria attramentaria]